MSSRVVVFDSLLKQHPSLLSGLEEIGAQCVPVESGKEVVSKVQETSPVAVILDVFMPQVSGIELCRQVKEATGNATSVVLVSDSPSTTIAQRAEDYGCDLYVQKEGAEEKILEFLRRVITPGEPAPSGAERREAPRYELSGAIRYVTPQGERYGELMNASETGVLFASAEMIP
jgi:DNA-binding NarL/FixJ family response regulator